MSGPIEATLYVSSDVKDTDVTVKILDVSPEGTAYNLDETIQRLRWRDGYDKPPKWLKPGEICKVKLSPMNTSNYFAPGHRIRIEVSSSNFPRFDRNLNTGGNNFDESQGSNSSYADPPLKRLPLQHYPFGRGFQVRSVFSSGLQRRNSQVEPISCVCFPGCSGILLCGTLCSART